MKYFSGFCLCGEKGLFKEYLEDGEFVVAGFSKGAQDALEYVLNTDKRVDKLQLISPAFFDYPEKMVELNLRAFRKNKEEYVKNFLKKAGLEDFRYVCECTEDELKRLFTFKWEIINELKDVKIEVFLGEFDRILALKKAYGFFKYRADVYLIKKENHFLRS